MYKKIISQDELSLVTLAEVKKQCRITTTFEDAFLESLIIPYSDLAQNYTNRMLTEGTATVVIEAYSEVVQLPFGEITAITEVLLDGEAYTDYTFNTITQKITFADLYDEAQVTFSAGYSSVPKAVAQAILMSINTAYSHRDSVVVGQTVANLPKTAEILLDSVKYYDA